ncbi:MAG TPA: hypothetical protein DEP45_00540 [Armatimonadetes bacterium]|nr:hypothetical protein [Armatimonadota bacterium]
MAQHGPAVAAGGEENATSRRTLLYAAIILLLLMLALSVIGQSIHLQPVALLGLPMTMVGVTVLVLVLLYLAAPNAQSAPADPARDAVTAALLPAVAVDARTGRIRAANDEAVTVFGRDHVAPGSPLSGLPSVEAREECERLLDRAMQDGETQTHHCAMRMPDGDTRCMRLIARPNEESDSSLVIIGFGNEEADEIASGFARIQERLMSNISHELRTPLNVVMGFSELLTTGTVGEMPANQLDAAQECHEGGERILRLITDILDVGRVRSYYVAGEETQLSPPEMIRRVENLLAGQARRQHLRLELNLQPGLEPITLEERAFKQLAYHLILNSMDRSSSGGTVRVWARREGADLLLIISDSGVEMRGDIPPQPLPELSATHTENAPAPPFLGLPLCAYLAGRLGGTLTAETGDEGVHFTARLPYERG